MTAPSPSAGEGAFVCATARGMGNGRHVALLRGINVGGKNVIPMAGLRAAFEALGFDGVETYIQSGNVLFAAPRATPVELGRRIERALKETFSYDGRVLVLSADTFAEVVAQAPRGFGKETSRYRYDVLFTLAPLKAVDALAQLAPKPGVDAAEAGEHALYFRRLIARAAQSRLTRLTSLPAYQHLTVRNWNTTTKLHALAQR